MNVLVVKWLFMTAAIMVASYLITGIHVTGFFSALFAAAALGFMNMFFRPILLILTLPINILSLGLFTFVINALMLKMASSIIPGFDVYGFWAAIWGSLVISVVGAILNGMLSDQQNGDGDDGDSGTIDMRRGQNGRWE